MARLLCAALLCAVPLLGVASAQEEDDLVPEPPPPPRREGPVRAFPEAAEALLRAVQAAAPRGVTCRLEATTPAALGWRASRGEARTLTVAAPSGAARVLGLLPLEGTSTPVPPAPDGGDAAPPPGVVPGVVPALVAVGPDLVVVEGPLPQVGLTLEAVEAARPALEAALSPLRPWCEGRALGWDAVPPGLTGVLEAQQFPYHLAVDLCDPPGAPVDLPAAWEAGVEVLAYRYVRDEGLVAAPTIAVRPR